MGVELHLSGKGKTVFPFASAGRGEPDRRSKERQVLVDLPLRHLTMVRCPFTTFQLDELVRNRPKRRLDHFVLTQLLDRLIERLRQNANALAADLGERALV